MVAEGNDALLEEFFDNGTLPVEHILDGLREAVRARRIFPVLCASALHNVASDLILNFIARKFPRPAERGPWKGTLNGKEAERAVKDSEPRLRCSCSKPLPIRSRARHLLQSGLRRVKNDANLVNARNGGAERLAHIGSLSRQNHPAGHRIHAGDIGGVAKLKDTLTGDTLDDKASLIAYPPVHLPEPSIAYAISAKTRNDEDRMGNAIQKILEEDNRCASIAIRRPRNFCSPAAASSMSRSSSAA